MFYHMVVVSCQVDEVICARHQFHHTLVPFQHDHQADRMRWDVHVRAAFFSPDKSSFSSAFVWTRWNCQMLSCLEVCTSNGS